MSKSLLIWFFLAFHATQSVAQETEFERCSEWQSFARTAMLMRQHGAPFLEALKAADAAMDEANGEDFERKMARDFLELAYRAPLAATEREIEISAINFGESVLIACMN